MPNPNQLATSLTALSNNTLDFHNIAGLAQQRARNSISGLWTHYSWREYMIRGGIVLTTLLAAAYGSKRSLGRGALYGASGFFISHGLAVIPIIQRRRQIIKETQVIIDEVKTKIELIEDTTLSATLNKTIDKFQSFQFPSINRGDAARNLVKKKQMIRQISAYLDQFLIKQDDMLLIEKATKLFEHEIKDINESIQSEMDDFSENKDETKSTKY